MRRHILLLLIAVMAITATSCQQRNEPNNEGKETTATSGILNGTFSVSSTKQVYFSQGNLQYQASTGIWRFAANQYDIIGNDNANISSSYAGWIDLFGWGTGSNPVLTSTDDNYYSTFTDWGANAISNGGNKANLWRTLTKDEWVYLFYTRANAATLFGLGSVNGVNGTIVLPDNWVLPAGVSFTASTTQGLADTQGVYYYNSQGDNFSHNTYTMEQWSVLESDGAIFLPSAGARWGTEVVNVGEISIYWSATPDKALFFDANALNPQLDDIYRCYGLSVRLVQEVK